MCVIHYEFEFYLLNDVFCKYYLTGSKRVLPLLSYDTNLCWVLCFYLSRVGNTLSTFGKVQVHTTLLKPHLWNYKEYFVVVVTNSCWVQTLTCSWLLKPFDDSKNSFFISGKFYFTILPPMVGLEELEEFHICLNALIRVFILCSGVLYYLINDDGAIASLLYSRMS